MTSFSPVRLRLSTTTTPGGLLPSRILVFTLSLLLLASSGYTQQAAPATAQTLYSQGDLTDDEQYLMQMLNRARMDPVGEGQRLAAWLRNTSVGQSVVSYYGTDPDQVASDMAAFPAVMPLVFDPNLLMAARAHSADMAAHNLLTHTGSDGSTPEQRVKASGYAEEFVGENAGEQGPLGEITGRQDLLDLMHAGYFVDWGNPDFGHRKNSMRANAMNVVGLGVAIAGDDTVWETEDYGGPFLAVTKNAHGVVATFADVPAMLTGVVYNDANGNGQYDLGEGIAGVTVSMDGGKYYTVTSASGGYALPMVNAADGSNADGTVPVRMVFADAGVFVSTVTVPRYAGANYAAAYGSYRGNVEWDATTADDQPPTNPDLPYFKEKPVSVEAGGVVKIKVFRPSNSDMTQLVTVAYKVTGTAVAGVDYDALPGTVIVPAGKATAKIKVTALDNPVLNQSTSTPTLRLKLKGVAGAHGKATVMFKP